MSDDRQILCCYRVADNPVPDARSFADDCSKCGAPIWVAYSSPAAERVCMQCGVEMMRNDPDAKFDDPTLAQVKDILDALTRKPS